MADKVILAHSELRSLVTKAARGAGLAWGIAEEAGWAAEWLARKSLPAADWATTWLASAINGHAGPVETGVSLADRLALCNTPFKAEALPDDLSAPGYLLPFLHRIATTHGPIEVTAGSARAVRVEPDGTLTFGAGWALSTAGWSVAIAPDTAITGRPSVGASVIECLEGLALRTTVPPSATSRNDAGSATPDND